MPPDLLKTQKIRETFTKVTDEDPLALLFITIKVKGEKEQHSIKGFVGSTLGLFR